MWASPPDETDWEAGVNFPSSGVGGAAWLIYSGPSIKRSTDGSYWGNISNIYLLASVTANGDFQPVLSAEELWGIDSKIDDGMPASGIVQTTGGGDGSPGSTELDAGDAPCIDESAGTVEYNLGAAEGCLALFPRKEHLSESSRYETGSFFFDWEGYLQPLIL